MRISTIIFFIMVISGCGFDRGVHLCGAHPIMIIPELQSLKKPQGDYIQATAGYYITSYDREREVISPGGGCDRISYHPYKELEPALQKVLYSIFQDVKKLDLPPAPNYLKSNGITFAFLLEITTDSNSDSIFTWPPTSFTINLSCKAFSQNGKLIWGKKYTGVGTATYSEFKSQSGLAATRASQKVFSEMLNDLSQAAEFRQRGDK